MKKNKSFTFLDWSSWSKFYQSLNWHTYIVQNYYDLGAILLVNHRGQATPVVLVEQKLPTMELHMTSTPSCIMECFRKFIIIYMGAVIDITSSKSFESQSCDSLPPPL